MQVLTNAFCKAGPSSVEYTIHQKWHAMFHACTNIFSSRPELYFIYGEILLVLFLDGTFDRF